MWEFKKQTNRLHSLSGLGGIDFVYVKGKTAETIFKEAVEVHDNDGTSETCLHFMHRIFRKYGV